MSTLESIVWHVLGYAAIPLTVLTGIVISSVVFFFLAEAFTKKADQ